MFKELAPMVNKGTSLCIMITAAPEGNLTVAIIPKSDSPNAVLNTPLSVTASPEELDAELPAALTEYSGSRASLAETLENVKTIMDAAGKTAREEATKAATRTTSKPAPDSTVGDDEEENETASAPVRTISTAPATSGKPDVLSLF